MNFGHHAHKAHDKLMLALRANIKAGIHVKTSQHIAYMLNRSIAVPTFQLPDNGNLIAPADPIPIASKLFSEEPGKHRLPFSEVVIEYCVTAEPEISVETVPRHRFAYCYEPRDLKPDESPPPGYVRAVFSSLEFWFDDTTGLWMFDPCEAVVGEPNPGEPGINLSFMAIPGLPKEALDTRNYFGAYAALSLIVALSCKNVVAKKMAALSVLNAARLRRGKTPFSAYYVLQIDGQDDHHNGLATGGTHASPAMHVRRGHVRHLQNGRRTWVNACTVGASRNGIITKDYAVRGTNAA